MAFLSKARKADLLNLTTELDLIVPEGAKIAQLIKIITDDTNYSEEIAKNLLANIEIERLEAQEKEAEQANREYELQRLQTETLAHNGTAVSSEQNVPKYNNVNLIKPFESKGDIGIYLNLFERQASRAGIIVENYVSHLLTLLPLDIVNLIAREPDTLANDYSHVKKILLKRFNLSPEQFRINFAFLKKETSASWRDFAFELTSNLEGWLTGLEIKTFEELKDLIIIDQIRRKLPKETREHFLDQLPKFKNIQDLTDVLDDFDSLRTNLQKMNTRDNKFFENKNSRFSSQSGQERPFKGSANATNPSVYKHDYRSNNATNPNVYKSEYNNERVFSNRNVDMNDRYVDKNSRYLRNNVSQNTKRADGGSDNIVCFLCHNKGHKSFNCPNKVSKPVNNVVNTNNSSDCNILTNIEIMGKQVQAIVDTAASLNVCDSDVYKMLGEPKLEIDSTTLTGIGKVIITPIGYFTCNITLDAYKIYSKIYVVEEMNSNFILGNEVLNKFNFNIDEQGIHILGVRNAKTVSYLQVTPQKSVQFKSDSIPKQKQGYQHMFSLFQVNRSEINKSETNSEVKSNASLTETNQVIPFPCKNSTQTTLLNEHSKYTPIRIIKVNKGEQTVVDSNKENQNSSFANLPNFNEDEPDIGLIENDAVKQELLDLVKNYKPNKVKDTNLSMNIILTDEAPIYVRSRRMSQMEQQIVENQIQSWLKDGIIKESDSDFACPIVLTRKRTNEYRICLDFRQLNKKIVKFCFPLPLIEDVVDKLQNAKVFTSLDLRNGFFHVKIDPKSTKYTAFNTPTGHYEFLRVPFGLCISSAVFQRYINTVFKDLLRDGTLLIYVDDLIIPSQTEEEGLAKLKKVLQVASEYGLEINFKKCQLLKHRIEFLGYVIEKGTVSPSPSKTLALQNFPEPRTEKQVQSFLGLAGYFRKFVKDFATISKPLSDILRDNVKFKFGPEQREAFNKLKQALSRNPVLHIFKQGQELELHTDASSQGFGAVLLQKDEENTLHPIHYMSKKTNPQQEKYGSYELEALAIVEAVKKFRNYLIGTKFKIVTDCAAFQKTLSKKDLTPKIARWALMLEEFEYEIVHRPGKKMPHVDALSRNPVLLITRSQTELSTKIANAQNEDEHIKLIKSFVEKEEDKEHVVKNGILYKYQNGQELLVIPQAMQTEIVREVHNKGHFATDKTEDVLKQSYYIPNVKKTIENVISNCIECILYNRKRGKAEGFLNPIPKENVPLSTYHIDFIGPLATTNKQYQHILTVIDAFTKFTWLYPVKTTSAKCAIEKLQLQQTSFGNPARIISDKGSAFTSNDFEEYCQEQGIEHLTTTTGVHRGNGQVERVHNTLIPVLAKLSSDDPTKWYKYVSRVQRILNSTTSRSTKFSPFELLTGIKMKNKEDMKVKEMLEEEYINKINQDRDNMREEAKNNILKIQQENRQQFDRKRKKPRLYQINDMVAIQRTQFGSGLKLRPKFFGPYKVTAVKGNDRYGVAKIGQHEGPNCTSSAADHMKPWAEH